MKQLSWEEYYEKFYDWSESTQVRDLSVLTFFGTADEVGEIIDALQSQAYATDCPPHYGYRYGCWYYGHDRARL